MVVDTLAAKGLEAGIEYITDLATLQDYGVRPLPALLINGRVVVAGRVPAPVELEKILAEACRGE
jgi:predicted DsbA family dithiol-disulfide isomerase